MLLKIFAFCVLVYTVFRMARTLLQALARLAAGQQPRQPRPPRKDGQWAGPRPRKSARGGEQAEDADYVDV